MRVSSGDSLDNLTQINPSNTGTYTTFYYDVKMSDKKTVNKVSFSKVDDGQKITNITDSTHSRGYDVESDAKNVAGATMKLIYTSEIAGTDLSKVTSSYDSSAESGFILGVDNKNITWITRNEKITFDGLPN
jgi:hypothetical protein